MKFFLTLWVASSLFCLSALSALSLQDFDTNRVLPEDNSEIRQLLSEVFQAPLAELFNIPTIDYEQLTAEHKVRFEVRRLNDAVYLLFLNQKQDGDFSPDSRGSYIVRRDLKGEITQIKIFLQNDENTFIRITPEDKSSRMELVLYNRVLWKDISFSGDIRQVAVWPFLKIIEETQPVLNWNSIFPYPRDERWSPVRTMIYKILRELPKRYDMEDGAQNEKGEYVYIETLQSQGEKGGLNCSGLAKWILDGIYLPLTNHLMPIEPLKVKPYDLRGNAWSNFYETKRDPFFGLDWTRNLSYTLNSVRFPKILSFLGQDDVKDVPYTTFIKDVGYPLDQIDSTLYLLALKQPGYFYIGALNVEFGGDPVMKQFSHVAVLFPYFDENNEFKIVVIERAGHTSTASLNRRYAGGFVFLEKVEGASNFQLPPL